MTEVIGKSRNCLAFKLLVLTLLVLSLEQLRPASVFSADTPRPSSKPAEQLYLQLNSVELDPARVYQIREAALDYPKLHMTFDDGKIGFTSDIYGKITGAFFEGDGELLVVPPDQAERASLMLFTGAAILEERFHTAYFRFNDNMFSDLQRYLRPSSDGKDFVGEWGNAARSLAAGDALRMFMSFSRCLPREGQMPSAPACESDPADRFLHARIQGGKLGVFDVTYDSQASEQISIGQQKMREGVAFYNTWTQFASSVANGQRQRQIPSEIAIRSYDIDAQVNPPTNLQARAKLKIEVVRSGSRALLFELSRDLKVSTITADGAALEFIQNQAVEGTQLARRGNDLVAVVFPKALETGQQMELNFNYAGDVLSEAGGGLVYVGARGIWYPNRGMEAAKFDLHFRYPAGWSLLATGERVATNESSDEPQAAVQKSSHWVTRVPIPVAGFNLGRYSRAEARVGDAIVETYAAPGVERTFPKTPEAEVAQPRSLPGFPPRPSVAMVTAPPSPARNAQMVADTAAAAINFYAQRFGPYPYSTLRLTQMPGPLSQGWPGLIFLSSYSFLLPEERARIERDPVDFLLSKQVTAHETAHEWWGDLIYWRGYRDQWLSEGLANYCSLMILESENPAGFHQVLTRYRDNLLEKNKEGAVLKDAGPVTLGLRLSSSEFPDGYEAISYGRGTWLFHMLRHMLDDEPSTTDKGRGTAGGSRFFRALLKLREQYAGKPVTTRDVLQVFSDELPPTQRYEGKQQLQWFYEGWVNGTAIPHLQLQNVKFTESGQSLIASGIILQRDAPKDLVTSVPLFAQLAGNRRVLVGRVFADGPEATFHISVPAGTRKLLLDPDGTVLRN
ncbi:MAG TPA: M1 family aminopeptidase [Terriglobales bacterium]|nr:M1 family aminopeptidase [Terriglobales bacterium]